MYDYKINELINKLIKNNNFEEIEKQVNKFTQNIGCEIVKKVLEEKDKILKKEKSKDFISCGKRKFLLNTVMGNIEVKRRIYKNKITNKYNYLLDESLKEFRYIRSFSKNYCNSVKKMVVSMPFRKVSENLNKLSNNFISHQSIWNITQNLGEIINNSYKNILNSYDIESNNKISSYLLREEVDGVFLNMQGLKNKELKVCSFTNGIDNKGRLKNTLFYSSFINTDDFHITRELLANKCYFINDKTIRLLNTDGAKWCKSYCVNYDYVLLDKFHLNMNVIRNVRDNKIKSEIFNYIYSGQIKECLLRLKKLLNEYRINKKDKTEIKNIINLYKYIKNNIKEILNIIKLYDDTRILDKDKRLGVQESINRRVITSRMKKRGMSWSLCGATNLSNILCYIYSDVKFIKDLI